MRMHYQRSAIAAIRNSVSSARRLKKVIVGPDPRSPAAVAHDITLLNDDDDAISAESITWLLKCIFREPAVFAYAEEQLQPFLAKARTFSEARAITYKHFLSKSSSGEAQSLTKLDIQAIQAVLTHEADTRENQKAYNYDIQHKAESGFWPNPIEVRNGRSLYSELPYRQTQRFITRQTGLVSLGSCFAVEIAHRLQRDNFNYIVTEPNFKGHLLTSADAEQTSDSSAAWGIIFNSPSFRQVVERAFGLRELPRILWSLRGVYMVPFRDDVLTTRSTSRNPGHSRSCHEGVP